MFERVKEIIEEQLNLDGVEITEIQGRLTG